MDNVDSIVVNIQNVSQIVSGLSTTVVLPMAQVSEDCNTVLEELRTILILSNTHANGITEQLKVIDSKIENMDNIFDKITRFQASLSQAKSEMDRLEKLCNIVERQ